MRASAPSARALELVDVAGERVGTHEIERAMLDACRRAHAEAVDFTVAPRSPSSEEPRGGHDWLVEFAEPPRLPLAAFARLLDDAVQILNADYRARRRGAGMMPPRLIELPAGTFYRWKRWAGRPLGDAAMPRVANDRTVADALIELAAQPFCGSLIIATA